MTLSSAEKRVVQIAGILGTLQALFWFILSLLCLIYYYKDFAVDLDSDSFFTNVYLRFLDQEDYLNLSPDKIMSPRAFTAFNWLYVLFDFCWFFMSLSLVCGISSNSPKLYKTINSFLLNIFTICILDFILVLGIGLDYDKSCSHNLSDSIEHICQSVEIYVLVIVAKGFVLWTANVIFGYFLLVIGRKLKKEAQANSTARGRFSLEITTVQSAYSETFGTNLQNETTSTNLAIESSSVPVRLPRYEYKYQYAYRPQFETRYNSITGMYESSCRSVYSYGLDYVLTDD